MAKNIVGAIIFAILTLIFGAVTFVSLRIVFAIQAGTVENLGEFIVWLALIPAIFIIAVIVAIVSGAVALLFFILTIVNIIKAAKGPKKAEAQYSSGPEPKLG